MKLTARIFSSWICMLLLCTTVAAQTKQPDLTGHLRGSVADAAEAAAINYAFVFVHGSSGKGDITVRLDGHGKFDLRLPVGLYDIFVAADGFSPACKRVEITAGRTTTFDVNLQPDSEHLQSNFIPQTSFQGSTVAALLSAKLVNIHGYQYDAIRDQL